MSEINNVFGFSSSALNSSNVSKSKNVNSRKQTLDKGLGFSQFSSYGNVDSERFLFGGTNVNANVIVDDMSKMTIGSGDKNVLGSETETMVEGISKLKIDGVSNVESNVTVEVEKKMAEFAFTSRLGDIGTPYVEFKTPDMRRFDVKKDGKDARLKKKKGKVRNATVGQSRVREDFGFSGRSFYENVDSYDAYSPMDISPCDDKLAGNYSRETSVTSEEGSQISGQNSVSNVATDDEVSEPHANEFSESESFKSVNENMEYSSDTFVTALDDESSTATSRRQESVFNFASRSDNVSKGNFTFATSSSSQSQPSYKKKLPPKIVRDSFSSISDVKNPYASILSPGTGQQDYLKPVNAQIYKQETVTTSSSKIAEEACEKWRLRGNQAYSNGDLAKAEDCYTQGLNSVSQNEKSRSCLKALMLCYSNRAATRISLGRMKEALGDCLMAANIDPGFLKAQVRAAHCYLAMGEIENARKQYTECLQSGTDNSVDRKVITEASEGLEKAQKVSDCIKQCTDLFERRTPEDMESALRLINEALQISTCSEKLLQMKAEALFMFQRYEQVIQVCEQTLTSNEADTATSSWKPHLIIKSYFYLGRLDDALDVIKKQERTDHITERVGNMSQESAIPLADTIRELLSHKTAGNEAYISGKHAEAVEHYTAALSCNVVSRPFASVCFCNRAAAYRGLGQITDAIADCSIAMALDPNYHKAISRRASLYEMIRDYGQAAKDLQRLVSLLKTQVEEKGIPSGASDKLCQINELKQTQQQLSNVEEESRKGFPLNMYLILGVESTASAPEIKKAYRKAALRHHPDKAAQSLSRSDDGDDGLWKEIAANVYKDADRLFKMIGEAYAVLSNASKRSQYDQDEEMRNDTKRFTRSDSSRTATDVQTSVFARSRSQRQW
ncbi:dnaJ domain, Tetratricopeptide-like helical domain protein [Artemisia annua]|uniref:DnaJ domain, Tetratricopeptide-like helical domain protein n=1 Tax=Artemisia annua TaxID=35608 RepID=A0A2U1P5U8_ARTAN|nr:dnaJ domain, Tetratricopeptide-like helical domain protein [Artemisia annua]